MKVFKLSIVERHPFASKIDVLLLVVDLGIEFVVVSDQSGLLEGVYKISYTSIKLTFRFLVAWFDLLDLVVQLLPSFIVVLSVLLILLHCKLLSLLMVESQSFFKGKWIDLLKNGLQSN